MNIRHITLAQAREIAIQGNKLEVAKKLEKEIRACGPNCTCKG